MNKYLLKNFGITKLVLAVIATSSIISILVSGIILNKVIERYDEEMIQIVAGDIYDDISEELLKPIMISQTMASNSFLKQHLKNDSTITPEQKTALVTEYLTTAAKNFGYSSAFLAVEKSKHYYTLNGLQKTLNPRTNYHDGWYRDFVKKDVEYSFNVDTDEANNYLLTIFVNARIKDNNGKLLGVCGVGLGMNRIQKILEDNEKAYNIKINLVNSDGLVQVDTDSKKIEQKYLDKLEYRRTDEIVFNDIKNKPGHYIVTKYIPHFNWYLVIQRDMENTDSAFSNLVLYVSVAWVILLALLLTFIQTSLNTGKKEIEDSATKHGIASHSGLYATMHLIDLKKNLISELSSDPEVQLLKIQDGRHAKEKLNSSVKYMTNKESLSAMLEFINLETLPERMGEKQVIYQEFLSEDYGWCKAYFMLVANNDDGEIKKIVFAIEIIDEEKRREKHLQYLSETDAMTGLKNRGSGEKTITDLIAQGQAGMFCLLDADKFKSINDNFGHDVGDKVIKAIAECLKKTFRNSDVTLRLGGDEFAAYAVDVTDKSQGKAIIERLFSFIDKIDIPELGERKISISLGAAILNLQSGETFTELYKRADSAAYISKKTVGNCLTFAEDAPEKNSD